jgi:hypothetical protein
VEVNVNWVGWFDGEEAYECVCSLWCLGEVGELF